MHSDDWPVQTISANKQNKNTHPCMSIAVADLRGGAGAQTLVAVAPPVHKAIMHDQLCTAAARGKYIGSSRRHRVNPPAGIQLLLYLRPEAAAFCLN
jgi:hypothetical protein